ncbi:MAG: exported protein of unknown function [Rhodoferax sp.]|nr:exported protein of unknown function [Rhodoferax sp.]
MRRRTLIGAALVVPALARAVAAPLPQMALVIGNNQYLSGASLANPVNDARLMQRTLAALGVKVQLETELDAAAMVGHVEAFTRKARAYPGVVWVYYAGHGVQLEGRNYLVGTKALTDTPETVRAGSLALERLLDLLDGARPHATVVIVDACRDNPFAGRVTDTRSFGPQGLQPPGKERAGTLIAYATAPYTKALDWPGAPNGPYTAALCRALLAKPRTLEEALRETSKEVQRNTEATQSKAGQRPQTPWYLSSLTTEVWLGQTSVELRPLANAPLLAGGGTGTRSFRADLQVDNHHPDVTTDEWAELTFRLETQAKRVDRFEARRTLEAAVRPAASDFDRTLAGLLLEQGRLTEKNRALAAARYEKAALRGYVPAQVLLGELAFERANFADAYKWLAEAAKSGYGRPKLGLAQLTYSGQGTAQDPTEAVRLLMESLNLQLPLLKPR